MAIPVQSSMDRANRLRLAAFRLDEAVQRHLLAGDITRAFRAQRAALRCHTLARRDVIAHFSQQESCTDQTESLR